MLQKKAKLLLYWVVVALTSALVEQALNLMEAIVLAQPSKLINTPFFCKYLLLNLVYQLFKRTLPIYFIERFLYLFPLSLAVQLLYVKMFYSARG